MRKLLKKILQKKVFGSPLLLEQNQDLRNDTYSSEVPDYATSTLVKDATPFRFSDPIQEAIRSSIKRRKEYQRPYYDLREFYSH